METPAIRDTAVEACKVLDALATISIDLSCHREGKPDRLVLSAGRVGEVCDAIDEAVLSLKKMLQVAERHGAGPIPAEVLNKITKIKPDSV